MKLTIIILLAILLTVTLVTPAHADTLFSEHSTVTGSKVYPHEWNVVHTSCGGAPDLNDYLDGDTPTDIAIYDWSLDMGWHTQMCKMGWIQ